MSTSRRDRLVELRREFHRHPEPAWKEFWTTSRIVDEVESIGVDELYVGREALAANRLAVPEAEELSSWADRAIEAGADRGLVESMSEGWTGAIAVLDRGDGPVIGLRVDIDALPREESTDGEHHPVREGFRSETGAMHACGHDAHATIGIGVLEAIAESDFEGTLKVFFQPSEEVIGGGKPMAESGHLDDVEYLIGIHVGLDRPTGEVVAGIGDFLAVTQFYAEFRGEPGHAGARPEEGRNAVQAMATAVQNLYGIPRHSEGASRVNAGVVGGGTATNIIPEESFINGEVRGETTEIRDFTFDRATDVLEHAAAMHGCEYDLEIEGEAPSAESDEKLVDVVHDVSASNPEVTTATRRGAIGGSEDATFLMQRVQEQGGLATYVCIGTDHPGGHHTATFDVDEDSLEIGVDVIADSITEIGAKRP